MNTYKKGEKAKISPFFNSSEFDCHCTCKSDTILDPLLIARLEVMRKLLGKPIKVTSGFRCSRKQEELRRDGRHTAAKLSTHEKGMAADLWVRGVSGQELLGYALRAGFTSIGVANTWIHVDTRSGSHRWGY